MLHVWRYSKTLMWKYKKTLETSFDLTPLFRTSSVHAKVDGLVLNVDYLENWCNRFIQKKYGKKDVCRGHTFCSLECNFSFCTDFLHRWWHLKLNKRITNKAFSKFLLLFKQFLLLFIFCFQGMSFKTQFKIVLTSGKWRSVTAWINPWYIWNKKKQKIMRRPVNEVISQGWKWWHWCHRDVS